MIHPTVNRSIKWAFTDSFFRQTARCLSVKLRRPTPHLPRLKPGRADSAGHLPVRSEKDNAKQNESNHEDEHE